MNIYNNYSTNNNTTNKNRTVRSYALLIIPVKKKSIKCCFDLGLTSIKTIYGNK